MQIDINNKFYTIKYDDVQWVELESTDLTVRITCDIITDEDFEEIPQNPLSLKDKIVLKIAKKTTKELLKTMKEIIK